MVSNPEEQHDDRKKHAECGDPWSERKENGRGEGRHQANPRRRVKSQVSALLCTFCLAQTALIQSAVVGKDRGDCGAPAKADA